jgi:hypothetical protein
VFVQEQENMNNQTFVYLNDFYNDSQTSFREYIILNIFLFLSLQIPDPFKRDAGQVIDDVVCSTSFCMDIYQIDSLALMHYSL